jgi:endonuclease-3 related protein
VSLEDQDQRRQIVAVLCDHYGTLPAPGGEEFARSTQFGRLARVFLDLKLGDRLGSAAADALEGERLLEAHALAQADPSELAEVLEAAKVRVSRPILVLVRKLARWASGNDLDFGSITTDDLRDQLRRVSGIGPATADELLLFAFDRPVVPLSRAIFRILVRHGWADASTDAEEARAILEEIASDDARQLALRLERAATEHCKPGTPRCHDCPLEPLLPSQGMRSLDD